MNLNISGNFSLNSFVPIVAVIFGIIELLLVKIFPINLVFAVIIFLIAVFLFKKSFFDSRTFFQPKQAPAESETYSSISKPEFFGLEKKEIETASGITLDDFIVKAPKSFSAPPVEKSREIERELDFIQPFIEEKPKHVKPITQTKISNTVKEEMFKKLKILTREVKAEGGI